MGNSGSHNFSVITDYQLFKYTKRTLYKIKKLESRKANTKHIISDTTSNVNQIQHGLNPMNNGNTGNVATRAVQATEHRPHYQCNSNQDNLMNDRQNLMLKRHA